MKARKRTRKVQQAGRPSTYSDKLAEAICQNICEGSSLREITRLPNMPGRTTIIRWLSSRPEFYCRYERACEIRADLMLDDLLELADNPSSTIDKFFQAEGQATKSLEELKSLISESIALARLKIETGKWAMSKMKPKRFGDSSSLRFAESDRQTGNDDFVGYVIVPAKVPSSP